MFAAVSYFRQRKILGWRTPEALRIAVACQQAVEFVGMPEGYIPLAETVAYLALSRKSNSTYAAYLNAARKVKQDGPLPVPLHLRNATTALQKTGVSGAITNIRTIIRKVLWSRIICPTSWSGNVFTFLARTGMSRAWPNGGARFTNCPEMIPGGSA